jgi:hypothetical protein
MSHMVRRGDRDLQLWNYACDYAVNLVLQESRFPLGEGWLIDSFGQTYNPFT